MPDRNAAGLGDALAYNLEIPTLQSHPACTEITELVARQLGELSEAVAGDHGLLARIYTSIGLALYNDVKESIGKNASRQLQAAQMFAAFCAIGDQSNIDNLKMQSRIEEPPAPPTAWDVADDFRRTPEGMKLHVLQYGADEKDAGQIRWEDLPRTLATIAPTLFQIEKRFVDVIAKTTLSIHPSHGAWAGVASPEELANATKTVIFADYHLYRGYIWNGLARTYITNCIVRIDRQGIDALLEVRNVLPEYFAAALLDGFECLPTKFEKLLADIDAELVDGLLLSKARDLLQSFGIDRFMIAPKTWINGLCIAGHLEPITKGGKVAYQKGTVDWPTRH